MRKLIALLGLGMPAILLGLLPQQQASAAQCFVPESAGIESPRHNELNDERIYHVWCGGAL